ncbi:HpcH/HpaI aldolase/citrate lyase family protein [Nocardioides sp.]|uniref:HpcH/HpaI aldolase/citrate lyase family protein n=1 Tax=Nocardioides sp. TaxID=35761 RepID=UPI003D0A1063
MPELSVRARGATSWLFVPGDRPERFRRALDTGADVVVLDLEDGVAPDRKDEARTNVVAFVEQEPAVCVRINGATTAWHDDDLQALAGREVMVMVPKAADIATLDHVADHLAAHGVLIALLETAEGILQASRVATHASVHRLAFGSHDLAAQLAVSPDDQSALLRSRSELVLASAAAGLGAPVDGVTLAVRDDEALSRDVAAAAALGFGGKLCIHPSQVSRVRALFRPSPEQLAWAQGILAAAAGSHGVVLVDGEMVDGPVLARAERIVWAARE